MKQKTLPEWKQLYEKLHYKHTLETTPSIINDGNYCGVLKWYDVTTSGGLETTIVNILKWSDNFGEGVKTMGVKRWSKKKQKEIWTKTGARKGSSDVHAMFKRVNNFPIPVKFEIKIGRDTQKDEQKKYQKEVTKVGSPYHLIKTIEDFIFWFNYYTNYDKIVSLKNN